MRTKTKVSKAHSVLSTLMTGPAHLTDDQRAGYNLWLSTWVVPQLAELIPQLGDKLEYRALSSEKQVPIIHGYTCRPENCPVCSPKHVINPHPKGICEPVDVDAYLKGAYTWCKFCGKEMEK